METFTETFSTQLDSKGRVTVPANIRRKLGMRDEDRAEISIKNSRARSKEASNIEEAQRFIQSFESIESFSFDGEKVEVVLNG